MRLPFSRRLATYAISASPEGVSDEQLLGCIDDVAHCPAYFQLLVKSLLLPGLRELAENAVPAHLVICEKDRVVPAPRFSRHFTTHLPHDHQVTELDGVGHIPMFEAPERVADLITGFLDECNPAARGANPSAS
jgi:pimeloyl-ACP methyl ester carboxylesterase